MWGPSSVSVGKNGLCVLSVLIVLFFVLLAVMECYANGVLMSFLGTGALFVVAPDVHPLLILFYLCVCVLV